MIKTIAELGFQSFSFSPLSLCFFSSSSENLPQVCLNGSYGPDGHTIIVYQKKMVE